MSKASVKARDARDRAVPPAPTEDPFMSVAEIASYCRATPRQVRRWIYEGRFECVKLPKGRVVRKSVLDAWLEENSLPPLG